MVDRIAGELILQRARYGVSNPAIQDGAPELWSLLAGMAERRAVAIDHEVIDRVQVDERLAGACELITGFPRSARELYEAWRYQLDHSDTAIDRIIRHIDGLVWYSRFGRVDGDVLPSFWRRRGIRALRDEPLTAVAAHLEDLRRGRRRIRYASRRREGLPIGSGATEGACKSLVTVRFKRSGPRWFESGVAPCLSLRALHLADRLRPAFARIAPRRPAMLEAAQGSGGAPDPMQF